MQASILLIGAGGIGCGAALALAASGVARIGVLDDDRVDESNLQRQILHSESSVGLLKTDSLATTLGRRFAGVRVDTHPERLTADNALSLFGQYDAIIDGSDNLGTKFLANDAAVLSGKPLVHAAAVGIMGHVLLIRPGGRPCYRCLFEELPPPDSDAPSCAEAGVLGPIPGAIGALAAREAILFLQAPGTDSTGALFRYDSSPMTTRTIKFHANPDCRVCGIAPAITTLRPEAYSHNLNNLECS
ncbi:MAG: HesA/MoeB/ThiF family protein [Deltaproteobacteria bacterium]|nr:HesA/MoeB/ThiF family protein [Deltaproteobacteria bacterium]